METYELISGYDKTKKPAKRKYRRMTVYEAKRLTHGQTIPFLSLDGTQRDCRVTGQVKRWKRSPGRVKVPIKYGLYESSYAESAPNASDGDPVSLLLVLLDGDSTGEQHTGPIPE